ncbi:blood group Rh(CE) polypeptide isoform X3 [Eptesicus fuscus]|uniref:blood group Rh(CE) polypeptide isoform X3 n=1 Tax=Eptesicus fuscus TaxID=29078 RepID=UPI00240406E2|nr:blood group Rh(CE) polypeptide isoform X3 [Eptesicus fuscus]
MASKYPRSMRGCLPLWILILEAALIIIFFFFASYDSSTKNQKMVVTQGAVLQDVMVMAALGLGFLTSSLWRYGWSSVAFNLFMLALGVQWAVLLDGVLEHPPSGKVVIKLSRIREATMSAMSVLISMGAILGKANLAQLVLLVLMEVTAFSATRMISQQFLSVDDHISMMHIHVFAAYFGLTVAWCLSRPLPKEAEEKEQRTTSPSLFAMLGTLFLWMFWPSFNSALLPVPHERKNGVFNTYYALAVSAVTAISLSALAHPQGKISMTHIHNAVLAGGVAVGASCHLIPSPWLAMVLGLVAGLISIGGAKCLPVCFNRVLGIHDTCGVHHTFGLPGLLGGITYIGLMVHQISWSKDPLFLIWLLDFKQKHPRKTRPVPKQERFLSHFLCVTNTRHCSLPMCNETRAEIDLILKIKD